MLGPAATQKCQWDVAGARRSREERGRKLRRYQRRISKGLTCSAPSRAQLAPRRHAGRAEASAPARQPVMLSSRAPLAPGAANEECFNEEEIEMEAEEADEEAPTAAGGATRLIID